MSNENNTDWDLLAVELKGIVDEASEWLGNLSEDVVSERPGAGQWSAKEILGHLKQIEAMTAGK